MIVDRIGRNRLLLSAPRNDARCLGIGAFCKAVFPSGVYHACAHVNSRWRSMSMGFVVLAIWLFGSACFLVGAWWATRPKDDLEPDEQELRSVAARCSPTTRNDWSQ